MVNRNLLRLSAALSLIGLIVEVVAGIPHPGGGASNAEAFAAYAASPNWVAIHLGEFIGMVMMLAGLIVLYLALNLPEGTAHWLGFFGALSAGVTLALSGVLYAVDGVANKQVDLAYVNAAAAEQAARFASAEAIRWLEWGLSSYQDFMWGLGMLLLGIVIVMTGRVSRLIGVLMGLAGGAWFVTGWIIGAQGFGPHAQAMRLGGLFLLAWILWLLIVAWRQKASAPAPVSAERAHEMSVN